jgi:hypothetical protein
MAAFRIRPTRIVSAHDGDDAALHEQKWPGLRPAMLWFKAHYPDTASPHD